MPANRDAMVCGLTRANGRARVDDGVDRSFLFSYFSSDTSHALAASISAASKYFTLAIVNGLHTAAIHFSQVLSPTSATRLILVQWVVENLMSSHSAFTSQPWKSWN